jgi:Kdo2-lipid IVA lauroyltransferase/acyltransferase
VFNYLIFRFFVFLFAMMPFRLLYLFSDFVYLHVYYLIGYRKKIVCSNMKSAYPELSEKAISRLMRKYYRHLCDILVEGLKGFSMSRQSVLKRHRILNPEVADVFIREGRSVIGLTGHYGNWEWGAMSSGIQIGHPAVAFYKPLLNKRVDHFLRRGRAAFNCALASVSVTYKTFEQHNDKCVAYIMVADQSPSNIHEAIWTNFLGRPTACLHGPEKYAMMYNLPVIYIHIYRRKRGYYDIRLELITENPTTTAKGELTAAYMKMLETDIRNAPEFWLWSHRRWKHDPAIHQDTSG